ncbi:TauD/TfdA dioxygenase family protein [Candidatus Poriferisocius sp.]|uniref:TauD/TfdA dioxygenase family protein n=1 Tax=Candidatus Poriferisocius sp. TaxID=3101276 RepID=UPI003B024E39
MAEAQGDAVNIERLGETIGAGVSGVSGRDLAQAEIAGRLLDALEQHGVLVFRDLHLTDPEQVAFSRQLGEVEVLPIPGSDHPEIFTVSLDPARATSAEYLRGTFFWHIDGATDDVPNKATMLNALEAADEGGDTQFCNTYAAWEALAADEQDRCRHLRVLHSFETSQRLVYPDPTDEQVAFWRKRPSKVQPLAWTHRSGRTSLVLGATADHVVDMDPTESLNLLYRLEEWATDQRFRYQHHWAAGDLVVWDNRGTMHRALPYTAASGRLMHRTTIVGDEPFS